VKKEAFSEAALLLFAVLSPATATTLLPSWSRPFLLTNFEFCLAKLLLLCLGEPLGWASAPRWSVHETFVLGTPVHRDKRGGKEGMHCAIQGQGTVVMRRPAQSSCWSCSFVWMELLASRRLRDD
jgi:hypothetical protein